MRHIRELFFSQSRHRQFLPAGLASAAFALLPMHAALSQSNTLPLSLRPASPETVSEEGLRRQEQRAHDLQLLTQPNAPVLSAPAARLGPTALPIESPCFIVREFILDGEDSKHYGWLLDILAPFTYACVGVRGLQHIAAALDTRLIEAGFVTTRVSLPPQNLADGVLRIQVHPGRVATIVMRDAADPTGPADARRGSWRNAFAVSRGALLNIRDLEQGVEQMNRLPSQSVRTRIEPGAEPETSDVIIERHTGPARDRVRGGLALDNAGSATFERIQLSAYLALDQVLGVNDILNLNLSTNLDRPTVDHRSQSLAASYSVPWGYQTITLSASHSRFAQAVQGTTAQFTSSGASDSADVRLQRTFWRTASFKASAYLGAGIRSANSFLDDVEVLVQRRRTSTLDSGVVLDQLMGNASMHAELGLRRGIAGLGAQDDLPGAATGGPTLRPQIWLLACQVAAPWQAFGQSLHVDSRWSGRFTKDRTLSIDQFSIGGPGSVRGFDGDVVLLAENGWSLRNEISVALAGRGAWRGIGYLALDVGRVWGPSAELLVGQKLAGAALGVRANVRGLQFDAALGAPLYKPAGFQSRTFNPYVSVSYGF